jgi:hypothetical protein
MANPPSTTPPSVVPGPSTSSPSWSLSTPAIITNNTLTNNVPGPFGLSSLAAPSQYFFTIATPNNQSALYRLSLYNSPTQYVAIGNPIPDQDYIFPLSPENLNKQQVALTNYYDIRGSATQYGVQRIVDNFGITPILLSITGTTGFQFHSNDGYLYTGRVSMFRLINIIQKYYQLLQQALNNGTTDPNQLPVLIWSEGFTGEVLQVVPIGPQGILMNNNRPIIQNYTLQFIVTSNLVINASNLQEDQLTTFLAQARGILAGGFLSLWNNIVNYAGGTIFTGLGGILGPYLPTTP